MASNCLLWWHRLTNMTTLFQAQMSTNKHSMFFDYKLVSGGPTNSFFILTMLFCPEPAEKSTLKGLELTSNCLLWWRWLTNMTTLFQAQMSTNKHSTFFDCKLVSGGSKNSFVFWLHSSVLNIWPPNHTGFSSSDFFQITTLTACITLIIQPLWLSIWHCRHSPRNL